MWITPGAGWARAPSWAHAAGTPQPDRAATASVGCDDHTDHPRAHVSADHGADLPDVNLARPRDALPQPRRERVRPALRGQVLHGDIDLAFTGELHGEILHPRQCPRRR